jgi:acyl carrier protein
MHRTDRPADGQADSAIGTSETVHRCYREVMGTEDPPPKLDLDSFRALEFSMTLSEELDVDFDTVLQAVLSSASIGDVDAAMKRARA